MPIRRRGDGEIINEDTEPVHGGGHDGPTREVPRRDAGGEPTYRIRRDRDQPGESLFGDAEDREWDAPTEPMKGRRPRGAAEREAQGPTRVYRGNRVSQSGDTSGLAEGVSDPMADPPVGWLVVVSGPGKGRVLTLGNGMNAIGRGRESRVRLDFGDDNVSRENHARLIYEPRGRRWLLGHGDGTNLTYLNGDVVVGIAEIESGAEIQLGETTMRFQAFCSKAFDWQDVDA